MLSQITTTIDHLHDELKKPAIYREADQTIHLPAEVVREVLNTLHWSADEIVQLREDRNRAIKIAVNLSEALLDAEEEALV